MAETFFDEGLDYIMSCIPGGGAMSALAIGAGTSATPTTVPARTSVIGGMGEPASGTGGYARVALIGANWGAPATNGSGRRRTAVQKSFPITTAAWVPSTVNFCFIAVGTTVGAGTVIYAANFDDSAAALLNAAGLVLRVTPFWQLDV